MEAAPHSDSSQLRALRRLCRSRCPSTAGTARSHRRSLPVGCRCTARGVRPRKLAFRSADLPLLGPGPADLRKVPCPPPARASSLLARRPCVIRAPARAPSTPWPWRCPRLGPQREDARGGTLAQARADLGDHHRVLDARNHPHRPATRAAGLQVDSDDSAGWPNRTAERCPDRGAVQGRTAGAPAAGAAPRSSPPGARPRSGAPSPGAGTRAGRAWPASRVHARRCSGRTPRTSWMSRSIG